MGLERTLKEVLEYIFQPGDVVRSLPTGKIYTVEETVHEGMKVYLLPRQQSDERLYNFAYQLLLVQEKIEEEKKKMEKNLIGYVTVDKYGKEKFVPSKEREVIICKNCTKWTKGDKHDQITTPIDEDTYEDKVMPFEVRYCRSPKLIRFERPIEKDSASCIDGSEYMAKLATSENYGCIHFKNKKGKDGNR